MFLYPYGETGLNELKREDLFVRKRQLADLGFSRTKQRVMHIFLNE